MSKEIEVQQREDLLAEIRKLGSETREVNKKGSITNYPDRLKRAIFSVLQMGLSPRFIASQVNIPASTIYSWRGSPKNKTLPKMRCLKVTKNAVEAKITTVEKVSKFTITLTSGVILELPDTKLLDQSLLLILSDLGG